MLKGSSGILELESDSFKLNCSQTLTGVKFIVVSDLKQERGQRMFFNLIVLCLYLVYCHVFFCFFKFCHIVEQILVQIILNVPFFNRPVLTSC
jgi:Sybindin-like family